MYKKAIKKLCISTLICSISIFILKAIDTFNFASFIFGAIAITIYENMIEEKDN